MKIKIKIFKSLLSLFVFLMLVGTAAQAKTERSAKRSSQADAVLEHIGKPWKGDLNGIAKRGFFRVLTVNNPIFFHYNGLELRGAAVDSRRALEKFFKRYLGRKARKLHVVMIPLPRDQLFSGLQKGKGDMIAANLTITPARRKIVDFSDPAIPDIQELVVTGPSAPKLASLDDLVKTKVHVRKSSSYYEHLMALNKKRRIKRKKIIRHVLADENLEDYDLLEMVNAGLMPAVIVDSHKASLWSQVFKNIRVHKSIAIHKGDNIAFAIRKNSPKLMKAINLYVRKHKKGTLSGNIILKRYLSNTNWIDNSLSAKNKKRFNNVLKLLKKYSVKYNFDWLMIAAQGYQESKLDQKKRSKAGAIGVMQVMPRTARDHNVNIGNINKIENNIHAGVKYLRFLRDKYFNSSKISDIDKILFSFAAYNAGPANIARARKRARKMGFNQNRWFGHVEVAASRTISQEPVIYVRNIYKYYVAYKLLAKKSLAP